MRVFQINPVDVCMSLKMKKGREHRETCDMSAQKGLDWLLLALKVTAKATSQEMTRKQILPWSLKGQQSLAKRNTFGHLTSHTVEIINVWYFKGLFVVFCYNSNGKQIYRTMMLVSTFNYLYLDHLSILGRASVFWFFLFLLFCLKCDFWKAFCFSWTI